MQNKYDILNKISDKETKIIIAKVFDVFNKSLDENKVCSTLFLSPNLVSFVMENFNDSYIKIKLFGGYENAERVCIAFYPSYEESNDENYNIDLLKIEYNSKYSRELKHSDFLGSIMGLSIKRELIGDIILDENIAYVFVSNTISKYIIENLKKVGNTNVNIEKIDNNIDFFTKPLIEQNTTVTSLRADVLISKIFNLSRGEVKELFESGKVFINWVNIFDISKMIKDNDVITLRGYGRLKYLRSVGTNKKGKISIIYYKY